MSVCTEGLVDIFRIVIDSLNEFTRFFTAGLEILLDDVGIEDLLMVLNLDVETAIRPHDPAARSHNSYVGRSVIRPSPVTFIFRKIDVSLWQLGTEATELVLLAWKVRSAWSSPTHWIV
jgi:hypothetical protein